VITVTKAFGKVITATKVTRITFYGLRHTHISHLLMDNVHPKVVSERAGHHTGTLRSVSAHPASGCSHGAGRSGAGRIGEGSRWQLSISAPTPKAEVVEI
jgi:hypothetical protein